MPEFSTVAYADGDMALLGHHARPDGPARAAVAIFPSFMNVTPGVKAKAELLTKSGYAVFIGDFYGSDSPKTPDEAFAAMQRVRSDPLAFRRRLRATIAKTAELAPGVPQLAIGFCLGGMAALEMARDGQDLAAVVSFHGLLATDLPASEPIATRMLICHGDADTLVPRQQVMAFWEEMDSVQADWHFHSYSGVAHGFTVSTGLDGKPNSAYDASADRQSWASMHSFFDEVLG